MDLSRQDRLGTDVRNTLIDLSVQPRVERLSSKQASAQHIMRIMQHMHAERERDRVPSHAFQVESI